MGIIRSLCFFIFLLFFQTVNSQIVTTTNYPMATYTNVPLEDMTGATTVFGSGVGSTLSSAPIKLGPGFLFCLAGYCYDSLTISTQGSVSLGTRIISQFSPILTPLSNYMSTGNDGYIKYKLIGSYPNRKFVVHWKVHLTTQGTSYSAQDQFQLSISESGRIDFKYGSTPLSWAGTNGFGELQYQTFFKYDIGIGQPHENVYVDVTPVFSSSFPLHGSSFAINRETLPPQSRISFIPDSVANTTISPCSFGNICNRSMQFIITDTTYRERYYDVIRSVDGINYNRLVKRIYTSPNSVGQTYFVLDTGLTMATHYYYAITSGNLSLPPDTVFLDAFTLTPQLSGVKSIPGDYNSITEALNDIRCKQLASDVVLELTNAYSSNNETFPFLIDNTIWTGPTKKLTIRPAIGASALEIKNTGPNPLLKLKNTGYFEMDGRPGGVGTSNELTLKNDTSANYVVQISSGSNYNSIRNCNIQGKGRWDIVQQTLVMFDSLNNSNNVISSCEFSPASSITWVESAIAANGSKTSMNRNNVVSDCRFDRFGGYKFKTRNSSDYVYAIDLKNGNTDWTFSGNSFYMTDTLKTWAINTCININSSVGGNFKIINNKFGGSAPDCSGNKMEISASGGGSIKYLYMNVGGAQPSLVRNNVVQNIRYKSDNNSGTCCYGYDFFEIKCNNLVVDSNLFGDTLLRSSIDYYFPYTSGNPAPIDMGIIRLWQFYTLPSTAIEFNVNNNVFGGLNLHAKINVNCIDVINASAVKDFIKISSNIIGGSIDSSIVCYGNLTGVLGGAKGEDSIIVDKNRIKNISTGIAAYKHLGVGIFRGIWFKPGTTTALPFSQRSIQITDNKIFNIRSHSGGHNAAGQSNGVLAIQGIQASLPQGKMLIENNHMHTFHNRVEGRVAGIDAINGSAAEMLIKRNFIHNFINHSNGNYTGDVYGMWLGMGVRIENNMIALGHDEFGQVVDSSIYITGIRITHSSIDTALIYHNSISIGGGSQNKLYGNGRTLHIFQHTQGNYRNVKVKNNIFSCFRFGTNSSANTVVEMQYDNIIKTLFVSDYNQYYAGGTSTFMQWGTSFQSWQQSSGMDAHSFYNPPKFVNALGGSQSCDLHLQFANFSEGMGTPIGIPNDFDNDNRLALTPVDIGADAGNFHLHPQINLGPDISICAGDSALIGVGPFDQYQWSTGASSSSITVSSAGVYSLTVTDALGYQASDSIALLIKPLPTVSATVTNSVLCAGNTTTLIASGASSYTWSSGATTSTTQVTPLSPDTYSLLGLASNGCRNSTTVSVVVNPLPIVTVMAMPASICSGETSTLTVSGASTYTWSSGEQMPQVIKTPTVSQTYTVTGQDNNTCLNSTVFQLVVNNLPTISAVSASSLLCSGESTTLTANGAQTYTWSSGANGSMIPISPTSSETYTIYGMDSNGCLNSSTVTQSVSLCTGLSSESLELSGVTVFPNPNNGDFVVRLEGNEPIKLIVFSEIGQQVFTCTLNSSETKISLDLANGIYYYKIVKEAEKAVFIGKLIIQH